MSRKISQTSKKLNTEMGTLLRTAAGSKNKGWIVVMEKGSKVPASGRKLSANRSAHAIDRIVASAERESKRLDRRGLEVHYAGAIGNWNLTLDERDALQNRVGQLERRTKRLEGAIREWARSKRVESTDVEGRRHVRHDVTPADGKLLDALHAALLKRGPQKLSAADWAWARGVAARFGKGRR